MYAEFDQFSVLSMSNSELFLVKDDQKGIEFDVLMRPTLEFQDECHGTASNDPELHHREDGEKEGKCESTVSSEELKKPSLGEFKVADINDDEDGFQTPTSLDHKITVIKQCPPAPRKPKPLPSTKRKVSPGARRNLQLDLSKDVESLFPPALLADIGRKIKKARKDDTE